MQLWKSMRAFTLAVLLTVQFPVLLNVSAEQEEAAVITVPAETEASDAECLEELTEMSSEVSSEDACLEEFTGAISFESGEPAAEYAENEENIVETSEWKEELPAEETEQETLSGLCGDQVQWQYDGNGLMLISGTGKMWNYGFGGNPWKKIASEIAEVQIQSGVSHIGEYAFYGCNNLVSVAIPETVTSIGDQAFWGCRSLEAISIPEGVSSIGENTFYRCVNLASVHIPQSVTSIGNYAFDRCVSLEDLLLPDALASIGEDAFMECTALTSVTIPGSVLHIGTGAFMGCSSLEELLVAEENPAYCSRDGVLFTRDMTHLVDYPKGRRETAYTIPEGVTSIAEGAFRSCQAVTLVSIPESMEQIEAYAFYRCTALTSVYLPERVQFIGESVWTGCNNLTEVHVSERNAAYRAESGVLFTQDMTELLLYPAGKLEASYQVPEQVTVIQARAFEGCTALEHVQIPESVTQIEELAFKECTGLISVNIPELVTDIYGSTFYGCSSLRTVTLPERVKSIGISAFSQCKGLKSVIIRNPACTIDNLSNTLPGNAVIYGYNQSTANQYANHYGRLFISLDMIDALSAGDMNGDETVNASDAAVVLHAAAVFGAGETMELSEAQKIAADVNQDGIIDAEDAAAILMYAAAAGAGNTDVSIRDFI